VVGKHFKSLCPRNTDPYSIIQKRRAQGILTPQGNKGTVLREWQREVENKEDAERREVRHKARLREGRLTQESSNASVASSSPSPILKAETLKSLDTEIEDKPARFLKDGSVDIDEIMAGGRYDGEGDNDCKRDRLHGQFESSSREVSPASGLYKEPKKRRIMKGHIDETTASLKVKIINHGAEALAYSASSDKDSLRMNESETEMVDEVKTDIGSCIESNHNMVVDVLRMHCGPCNDGDQCRCHGTSSSSPCEFDSKDLNAAMEGRPQPSNSTKYKINPNEIIIDESDSETSDEMDFEIFQPPKQYSEYVQILMQHRPHMYEVVNTIKRRPRAADLWKLEDLRRRDETDAK
jgi:hypothetical protein